MKLRTNSPALKTILYFLVHLFSFSSVYAASQESPYQTLSNEKPLAASSRFVVVDDFNTGKFTVRQGATWRIKQPAIGALDLSVDKQDARNSKRGNSLKAVFNLSPKEQVFFEAFLDRIDVSQAKALVFKVKAESALPKPFMGSVRVTLIDWRQKKISQAVVMSKQAAEGKVWDEITVPAEAFKGLDNDQLVTLRFSILSHAEPARGTLWIDEIAFFGEGDLAFENHRDNLIDFPKITLADDKRSSLKAEKNDKKLLRAIAADTWEFFKNAKDKQTNLIVDHIRTGEAPLIGDYTSTTNIAMDFLAIVSAMKLQMISREEALSRVTAVLDTLARMSRYDGFFYNFYDTKKLLV